MSKDCGIHPIRHKEKIILFYVSLYVFLVLFDCCLVNRADDVYLQDAVQNYGTVFNWIYFWATSWSGRIIPQGILVWLMQYPDIFFHLADAGMWIVFLHYTIRNLDVERVLDQRTAVIGLYGGIFLLIPDSVLSGSVYWKCANVSYLWGTAAMMVAIYPFVLKMNGRNVRKIEMAAAVAACIFSAGYEQSGALMSGIMACILVYLSVTKHKLDVQAFAMTILSCAATAFFLMLPGNAVRTTAETIKWYPNFDMFSLVDHSLLGIHYTISNILYEVPELFLAIALLNLWYVSKKGCRSRVQKLMVFATTAYWALAYFDAESGRLQEGDTYLSKLFSLVNVNTVDFGLSKTAVCGELLAVGMIVLLGMSTALLTEKFNLLCWGLFFGGLSTMAMMGFSPTIYASGARPRFIGYYCLVCCIVVCIVRNRRENAGVQNEAAI